MKTAKRRIARRFALIQTAFMRRIAYAAFMARVKPPVGGHGTGK